LSAQLRLSLERAPSHAAEAFVVSASNAAAVQALERWPDWRGHALALIGPQGSGKTHLAQMWAARRGAVELAPEALDDAPEDRAVLVEDVDGRAGEEALFHLFNRAAPGASLLLTSRTPPGLWPSRLPDLRSRLNALPVARLEEPDDAVLAAMLEKFFAERNIRPGEEVIAYLLRRIERSAGGAAVVVARIDEAADQQRRPVSRALAREVLGEGPGAEDGLDL
jgi:chromosomal replication initiation ATPase DnaA